MDYEGPVFESYIYYSLDLFAIYQQMNVIANVDGDEKAVETVRNEHLGGTGEDLPIVEKALSLPLHIAIYR